MRFTIADTIVARCLGSPERAAIQVLDGSAPLSYATLLKRLAAIAAVAGRVEHGRFGPMVGLLMPNGADAALAFAACQWAGVVAVPVNARLAEPEVEFILANADVRLLLSAGALARRAEALASNAGIAFVDLDSVPAPAAVARPVLGEREVGEDWAVIAYTSGTTGFPKGAIYTNDYFSMNNYRWGWAFGLSDDHTMLIAGPMFHLSYAGFALAGLTVGANVRVMPEFDPELALEELQSRCSFAFLVPSMLAMIGEVWEKRGRPPLAAARMILSAGAPWAPSLIEKAMAMFPNAKVAEMYGWTEGAFVTFEFKDPARLVPRCVGWPALGADVALFRADGEPSGVGEPGEIGVRSGVRFGGYLGNPEASAAAWHRGYLMSGDIGVWQADGRLCLLDRKKDMIITGGENVYPIEVERVLIEHPAVADVAVVGLPDPLWGERLAAMVVMRAGAAVSVAELEQFCRARIAGYKIPRQFAFAGALPKTALGKIQRYKVTEALR